MNSRYLAILLITFGLFFTLAKSARFTLRNQEEADDDNNNNGGGYTGDTNENDDNQAGDKRTVLKFLEDNEDASQFLDNTRRLFGGQLSHMKEAKKKYEEKCERLLHPRYCPDLATWPAWNQAFNSATKKK